MDDTNGDQQATTTVSRIDRSRPPFTCFHDTHRAAVEHYLTPRVRDSQLRAEVAATVFVAAHDNFDLVGELPEGRARGWLLRVAAHKTADAFRSERRQTTLTERAASQPAEAQSNPEDKTIATAEQSRIVGQVRDVLANLGRKDRAVLELHVFYRMGGNELADELNISPTAARIRLMRARRRFAETYIALYGQEVPLS